MKNNFLLNYGVIKRSISIACKGDNTMEKLFYSVSEVANVLGISRSYAYQMVKEKRIPTLEIGKRRVIPKGIFEQWVKENTSECY